MNEKKRMAKDNVAPIGMTRSYNDCDFESCTWGWNCGQALCIAELDKFVAVTDAQIIEVIPKRRPGKNHLRIAYDDDLAMKIDGARARMYRDTVTVGNHWIDKGYKYVRIDVLKRVVGSSTIA